MDSPNIINSLGNSVHIFGFAFPTGFGKNVSEICIPKGKKEVFYCSGACVLASREILNEFGGLDSNYWKYYEDVNLGWKGRLYGYPSYLVAGSTIYHKWGGTFGQELSTKKLYYLERGRVSSILVILFAPMTAIGIQIIICFLPRSLSVFKTLASIDVLRNLRMIVLERKQIQAHRRKKDWDVTPYTSLYIEHPYITSLSHVYKKALIRISKLLMNML